MSSFVAAVLLGVSSLTGCSGGGGGADESADAEPVQGGNVNWLLAGEPVSLDPKDYTASAYAAIFQAIYGTLVRTDAESGDVIYQQAEAVEANEDATEWTITLRPNLTFTDGTPLDAAALVANWDRLALPETGAAVQSTLAGFTSWEAIDDQRVVVKMPYSRGAFPNDLAFTALGLLASPTALTDHGEQFGTADEAVVGAGPFVVQEWVRDSHVQMVRNDEYWDGDKPYLDEARFTFVSDITARTDAIASGAAEVAWIQPPGPYLTPLEDLGFVLNTAPAPQYSAVTFNFETPPFDDLRVRRAVVLASDLDEAAETVSEGWSPPVHTWFPEGTPLYDPDLVQESNDLDAAQGLIDDYVAEHGGPVRFTIIFPEPERSRGVVMQQQVNRLENVEMDLEILEIVPFVTARDTSDFQGLHSSGPYPGTYVEEYLQRFHSESPANYGSYANPELDRLLEEGRALSDTAARKEVFGEIVTILLDDVVVHPTSFRTGVTVTAGPIRGVEMLDATSADPTSIWVAGS